MVAGLDVGSSEHWVCGPARADGTPNVRGSGTTTDADGDRVKVMDLDVDEFLRRFLLHMVPDGFVRIRHFGLLANRRRAAAPPPPRPVLRSPPVAGAPAGRCPRLPPSSCQPPAIQSPYAMRARGFVQLVLSAMLDARRITA